MKESQNLRESTGLGALDIVNQALDAMQSTITRQKLAAYPADYKIEIAVTHALVWS